MRLATLKTRSEFTRVKNGGKWAAKSFVLQAMVRDTPRCLSDRGEEINPQCLSDQGGEAPPRFGFTVASRSLIDKNEGTKGQPPKRPGAVMRNRAKRRLKEAVRLLAPVYARSEYDYVIIARREALHQTFSDLLEDLRTAFGKVHRPPRDQAKPPAGRAFSGNTGRGEKRKNASGEKGAANVDSSGGRTGGGASYDKG